MKSDFDVSIFIVTGDGSFIHESEYNEREHGVREFLMITNDILNPDYGEDSTIFLYKKWQSLTHNILDIYGDKIEGGVQWQINNEPIPNIIPLSKQSGWKEMYGSSDEEMIKASLQLAITTELNGYKQTNDIIDNVTNSINRDKYTLDKYIPAIYGAKKQEIQFNNTTYHGYMPSIGQLVFLSENTVRINNILSFGFDLIPTNDRHLVGQKIRMGGHWWSSSIWLEDEAMTINNGVILSSEKEWKNKNVIPLFKLK